MKSFLRAFFGMVFRPATTLRRAAAQRALILGGVIWLLSVWSWTFSIRHTHGHHAASLVHALARVGLGCRFMANWLVQCNGLVLFVVIGLLGMVAWMVRAAVLHLVAEWLGGVGKALGLLAALGHAAVPLVLMLPVALGCTTSAGGPLNPGQPATLAWYALAAVLHLWTLVLVVVAIKESHELSWGLAVWTLVLPLLALLLVVLLFTVSLPLSGLSWDGLRAAAGM